MLSILGGVWELLQRASSTAFLPVRRATGPLHRRRSAFHGKPPQSLPLLSPPWNDQQWFRGDFPPHQHNLVEPLLHGNEYFSALHESLRGARGRVTIVGWCLTPLMPILRDHREQQSILADLLKETSKHAEVYVLLWCGAPALFQPTERMVKEVRQTLLERAPRVRCVLDHSAPFSHDQHQKAVTIDGRVAYVGGMDLTTFQGDRWDVTTHPLRFGPNWHDAQTKLQGEVVADVEQNFCQRWNAVTGEHLTPLPAPDPDPTWNTPAQIVRTIPAGFYQFAPDGIHGIYHAMITAIQQAQHYIYMENQYLWAPEVVDALAEALDRPRDHPFRVVVVLPAKAYSGKFDNDEHVRQLSARAHSHGHFQAYSLYTGGPAIGATGYHYLPVYVHAKISLVDDRWLSIGSANLNRRGLATDAEMNVQLIDPPLVLDLRRRLWAQHLGLTAEEIDSRDPVELIDQAWPAAAQTFEEAFKRRGPPPAPRIRCYVPGNSPAGRVLDLIQDLTLEH